MTILIFIFSVLLFLLALQFAQQRQKPDKYFWFSNSKLATRKWEWWRWIILCILCVLCIHFVLTISPKLSYRHIIVLCILITIYWSTTKIINRLTSFRIRLLIEFFLIILLYGIGYLGLQDIDNFTTPMQHPELYLMISNKKSWWEIMGYIILNSLFLTAIIQFIRYNLILWNKKQLQKKLKLNRLKEELNIAQLEMLQARINPHFLYNSLNSIAGLALTDGENTRRMALSLSRFFSYCTNKNISHLIPVSEELEITKTYLDIEKIRFGEKLDFQIIVKEETNHFLIPKLLLQPLAENSVKHGMEGLQEKLCITILVYPEKTGIHILVRDNGIPFPEDLVPGYGLKSIYDKLDILFPESYEVELHNFPKKEISIRLIQKNSHEI